MLLIFSMFLFNAWPKGISAWVINRWMNKKSISAWNWDLILLCVHFSASKSDVGSRSSGRKPPGPRIGVWSQNWFLTRTKPLGANINQIRHVHPVATPCLTSWCSGVVGFLRAIERRLRLIGYFFRAKFGWRGDLIPWSNCNGWAKFVRLSWSKKSTIPQ